MGEAGVTAALVAVILGMMKLIEALVARRNDKKDNPGHNSSTADLFSLIRKLRDESNEANHKHELWCKDLSHTIEGINDGLRHIGEGVDKLLKKE